MRDYEKIFDKEVVKECKKFFLELAKKGTIQKLSKNEEVKFDALKGFGIVIKGRIGETFISNNGGQKELYYLTPGDTFAELNFIEQFPLDTYLYAKYDSEVSIVPGELFYQEIAKDWEKAKLMYHSIFRKYQIAKFQMLNLVFSEAINNVADTLYRMTTAADKEEIDVTQQNLSDLVGCNRATVAKALNTLREKEIIETVSGKIKVLKMDELKKLADLI